MSIKGLFKRQEPAVVRIQGNVVWNAFYDPRSRVWTGVCTALNLNATGDTWGELQACANEAMQLLFEDLLETGELEKFLRGLGWTADPVDALAGAPKFDVPAKWLERNRYEELSYAHA